MAEQAASAALRPGVGGNGVVDGKRHLSIHSFCPGVTPALVTSGPSMNPNGLPCLLEIVG